MEETALEIAFDIAVTILTHLAFYVIGFWLGVYYLLTGKDEKLNGLYQEMRQGPRAKGRTFDENGREI